MKPFRTNHTLLALLLGTTLAACGGKDEAPATPLAYVPADTPYLLANLEPMPKSVLDANAERMGPLAAMYEASIDNAADELEQEKPGTLEARIVRALAEELRGKFDPEGIRSLGWTPEARAAIYGIGLVPVARVELGDPAAFEAFVARIEQRVGEKLPTASVGQQSYWRVFPPDEPIGVAAAIIDGDLVLTLLPKNASDALLGRLLGIERPADSLADGKALASLNAEWGYVPYGSGYVDTRRVIGAVLSGQAVDPEFLAATGAAERAPPSAECQAEFDALAAKMPRLVFGYTAFDATRQAARGVLVLEPALAGALAKIAAPVPGLGAGGTPLFGFGLSLDIDQANRFLGAQAAAVAAAPFKCESLLELNQGFAELQRQLANPVVFAAATVIKGFNFELIDLNLAEIASGGIKARVAIASDNPQALVAMARSNVPQFAGFALEPGAAPVALPAGLAPAGTPPIHLAAAPKALGIAIGAGAEQGLAEFIAGPGASGQPPLLATVASGRFYSLLAEAIRSQPELAEALADGADDEAASGAAAAASEELARSAEVLDRLGQSIERIDSVVTVGAKGVELTASSEFR